jgi:hypothetical protein
LENQKITAGADLLERHDVKPGTIPERLWRRLYFRIGHRLTQRTQAVVSRLQSAAADRLHMANDRTVAQKSHWNKK